MYAESEFSHWMEGKTTTVKCIHFFLFIYARLLYVNTTLRGFTAHDESSLLLIINHKCANCP